MRKKGYAIVSIESGNIIQYDEICNVMFIFPTKEQAEICLRKYDDGKYKRKWWQYNTKSVWKWQIKEVELNY